MPRVNFHEGNYKGKEKNNCVITVPRVNFHEGNYKEKEKK